MENILSGRGIAAEAGIGRLDGTRRPTAVKDHDEGSDL